MLKYRRYHACGALKWQYHSFCGCSEYQPKSETYSIAIFVIFSALYEDVSWPEIETVLRNYTRSTLLNYARSLAKVIYKTIQERLYTWFITF
jgi:hypothetical protein